MQERRGWTFTLAAAIVKPVFFATTKPDWRGGEKLPESGGYIIVLNHLTHIDPLTAAHFVYDHGRLPRYLAKAGLFKNAALRRFMTSAGQIPVTRGTRDAVGAYDAAVASIQRGEVLVVYPEGTITRDPGQWPMTGKTGAARIALATGCPVIPIGQWGAQELLPAYSSKPDLFPRKTISMLVGDPVDLSDLVAAEHSAATIREATDRIIAAITELVEEIRGEKAPLVRFNPREAGVPEFGNPKKKSRKKDSSA